MIFRQDFGRWGLWMLILATPFPVLGPLAAEEKAFDVVVYGATPGGIAAAVGAAREGTSVLLLEPTKHIGGVMSGGLSFSDSNQCDRRTLGGLFEEIHQRIATIYKQRGIALKYDVAVKDQSHWTYEPHIAQQVFDEMLKEAKVTVVADQPVITIDKQGTRITALTTPAHKILGNQFVDATYEGDLMALAKVSWTIGRESKLQYNESLAGHQFPKAPVKHPARDANGQLLPLLTAETAGEDQGDRHVMVYSFRMCLSADPENRVTLTKPPKYDPQRFQIARPLIAQLPDMVMLDLYPLPGDLKKFDGNNGIGRQISIGLVGACDEWCEASWKRRQEIWEDHKNYTWEFLWFLQTDTSVPVAVRQKMQTLGLAKDEFQQTNHWPPALYVREGRRMLGRYVLTQKDVLEERTKPDSIGISSFPIDSHDCQRVAVADGGWINEGTIFPAKFRTRHKHGKPYQVPYRTLTPKAEECTNLLVPVGLSCTHVAFCSIRVEPTWIVLGQSAGVAAAMCAKDQLDVQLLPIESLQTKLRAVQQVLELPEPRP